MSFATDVNTLMQDASLVAYCDGGVYYENLPDNFDLTENWLAYSFRKTEQVNCLDSKNVYTQYTLTCKIVAFDTKTLEDISDYLVDYLNGKTQGDIADIWFTGDNHTIDLEKQIYMNSCDFDSFYVG